jgi:glutamate-1-semialdehyde 2,1-aminomutase
VRKPGAQTSATILPIRPNGERPALHVPGATRLFSPADLDVARLSGFDAVVLGGPDTLAAFSASDLAGLVTAARGSGALVVVDVLHPGSGRDLERIGPALAGADWFCPNADQLLALTGRSDLDRAVADVLALGTGGVAVTLGADGCLVTDETGALVHVPAIEVPVVDTTGCGDAFTAGLLTGLLLGCAAVDAAWLGGACGSLVATGLGSDAGLAGIGQAVALLRTTNSAIADRIYHCTIGEGTRRCMPDQLIQAADHDSRPRRADTALRHRAAAVIPGGMYGHQSAGPLPPEYPQFLRAGLGARVWDVDGNEYVDLMCSYGPIVLGHRHPAVEGAARAQAELGDCQNGPGEVMVELAELLTRTVQHADWAMLAKNGTDATTMCCTIARAHTGRARILVARGAYHGAAPWCTPRPAGVTPEDRANLGFYTYNDLESVRAAVDEAGDDVAGIVVSPFRHDAGFDQELVDPSFARGVRALCTQAGAALILDDVRCGLRLHLGSSWEPIGVMPDLSAWSKAIANGYPLAAVLGSGVYRDAAASIFVTGSFWFSAVAMAAAVATIGALREENAIEAMAATGAALRAGIESQAAARGLGIRYTGPDAMPYLTFAGDRNHELASVFAAACARAGVYLHPQHNWFVSAAMTGADLDKALMATESGFSAVQSRLALHDK